MASVRIEKLCKTFDEKTNVVDPYFGGQNICEIMAKWGEDVPYVNYSSHSYEIAYAHGNLFTDFLAGNTTAEEVVNELQVEAEAIVSGSN